ncbi:uncharacterized protein RCC_01563 [Ramularia collo-cygni]|uniref:non-specific serine/threonine protein kinase n=1 Tax=Ramularia collo-cygni TaxID=112498 RepID=A0A2D3V2J5_9PEZI|nr:uncharacterized protein RCC_01563 [Ramularia collo-cygni]CZT15729.1 uncharacterized protein RCC_01563 [Ramularia collo-cygni]
MLLQRSYASRLYITSPLRLSNIRNYSALIGDSGREYPRGTLLRRHPQDSRFDIYKTESQGKTFIFKRVPKPVFDLSQRLANDIPSSQCLRMHVDSNSKESILVYDYFRDTLLSLLENDPAFPPDERAKIIMRGVGEAVQELHTNSWIHADIKPDNILVDWTSDREGNKVVTRVALGDFDIACKLREGEVHLTPHAIGNAMWRSPEGQTGLLTRASDIYSLGLVYIYTLGGGELLLLNDYQSLLKAGIPPPSKKSSRNISATSVPFPKISTSKSRMMRTGGMLYE